MEELEKEPTLSLSNHKRLSDRVDLSDYSLQMSRSMDKVKDLLNSYIENLMATEKCKVSRSSISLHPHNLETALDWYSLQAKEEMKQLMDKMTIAYAERFENLAKREETSSVSEYHIQEGIGQLGLLHPMFTFMNILCIGHPLLQFDAFVGKDFLQKYDIKMGHTYVRYRDASFLSDFMKFVDSPPNCGGDVVKTGEAAQWILLYPKSVAFLGACGNDMHLDDITFCIQEMSLAYKIETKAQSNSSFQLIIRKGNRWSEVYIFDPDVSSLTLQFIDRPRVANLLERAELVFISGSSCLLMNMDLTKLSYFSSSRLKTLCLQICDGIVREGMEKTILDVAQFIDIFFLSTRTAMLLIKMFKIEQPKPWCFWSSKESIASSLQKWLTSLSKKPRTVIMYHGIKTAYVAADFEETSVKKYCSKFYNSQNIIDLYGCENAFAGGYVSQLVQISEIEPCINCAFFCASAVATQIGAHFPVNRQKLLMMWHESEYTDKDKSTRHPTRFSQFISFL